MAEIAERSEAKLEGVVFVSFAFPLIEFSSLSFPQDDVSWVLKPESRIYDEEK